uniref:Calponin-homology (CH) domain-containing protein n=1 Tax=Laticauda laticaudata TaxID=8630 RepID=A0A8C5RWE5_LATLA
MWHVHRTERELNAHLVCQMCCIDERDRVQKKTFTKWVNKHLMKVRKHINDLYEDLRDGHNLISLLEVLSGVKLPREKGRMRFHRLQNVQIALDFLKQRQVSASPCGPSSHLPLFSLQCPAKDGISFAYFNWVCQSYLFS